MKKVLLSIIWCIFCFMFPFFLGKYCIIDYPELLMFWGGAIYLAGIHKINHKKISNNKA